MRRLLASRAVLLVLADITARQLTRACGREPGAVCREILERTENRTLAEGGDFLIGKPLAIALIALVALIAHRLIGRAIDRGLSSLTSGVVRERMGAARRRVPGRVVAPAATNLRAEQRISALSSVLHSVAGFVVLLFACFAVLSEIGVDVAPLLAGAGVVGVALGFGSQSLVKDFLSGMFILVEDQFGVGDVVELDGETIGMVEAVSLRTTRLRAEDGTVWHVPNGAIVRVGNKSQGSEPVAEEAAAVREADEADEAEQGAGDVATRRDEREADTGAPEPGVLKPKGGTPPPPPSAR